MLLLLEQEERGLFLQTRIQLLFMRGRLLLLLRHASTGLAVTTAVGCRPLLLLLIHSSGINAGRIVEAICICWRGLWSSRLQG
jgi:hypothetical protein